MTVRQGPSGLFSIALRPCTVAVLRTFLPAAGLTAWIRGHRPERRVMWQPMMLPLRPGGAVQKINARDAAFDFQLPVERLLELLPELEDHGLDLYLMSGPVPNSLTLRNMDTPSTLQTLVANGMVGHFDLPHRMEIAVLSSPSETMLRQWLSGSLSDWVQAP